MFLMPDLRGLSVGEFLVYLLISCVCTIAAGAINIYAINALFGLSIPLSLFNSVLMGILLLNFVGGKR